MEHPFNTLRGTGTSELEIKRSRFLGRAEPLKNVETFQEMLARVRASYPDAAHHAFAYRLGATGEIARFSDDGEPGGTAGRPIMEMLLREEIVDSAVIVTRYWGGTLLGSGGLTRAYGQTASEAVRAAGLARMMPHSQVRVMIAYTHYGAVEQHLLTAGLRVADTTFADTVTLIVNVPAGGELQFAALLADITSGTAVTAIAGTVFLAG